MFQHRGLKIEAKGKMINPFWSLQMMRHKYLHCNRNNEQTFAFRNIFCYYVHNVNISIIKIKDGEYVKWALTLKFFYMSFNLFTDHWCRVVDLGFETEKDDSTDYTDTKKTDAT